LTWSINISLDVYFTCRAAYIIISAFILVALQGGNDEYAFAIKCASTTRFGDGGEWGLLDIPKQQLFLRNLLPVIDGWGRQATISNDLSGAQGIHRVQLIESGTSLNIIGVLCVIL